MDPKIDVRKREALKLEKYWQRIVWIAYQSYPGFQMVSHSPWHGVDLVAWFLISGRIHLLKFEVKKDHHWYNAKAKALSQFPDLDAVMVNRDYALILRADCPIGVRALSPQAFIRFAPSILHPRPPTRHANQTYNSGGGKDV